MTRSFKNTSIRPMVARAKSTCLIPIMGKTGVTRMTETFTITHGRYSQRMNRKVRAYSTMTLHRCHCSKAWKGWDMVIDALTCCTARDVTLSLNGWTNPWTFGKSCCRLCPCPTVQRRIQSYQFWGRFWTEGLCHLPRILWTNLQWTGALSDSVLAFWIGQRQAKHLFDLIAPFWFARWLSNGRRHVTLIIRVALLSTLPVSIPKESTHFLESLSLFIGLLYRGKVVGKTLNSIDQYPKTQLFGSTFLSTSKCYR
jgi:hypothetical protein